jgi:hypothetical protein
MSRAAQAQVVGGTRRRVDARVAHRADDDGMIDPGRL